MEQQYGVRPKTLQGGAKDMKEVNDWVSQETSNNVQRFLAKPLPRNSFIHTVSAAHFKGGQPCWRNPGGWGGWCFSPHSPVFLLNREVDDSLRH